MSHQNDSNASYEWMEDCYTVQETIHKLIRLMHDHPNNFTYKRLYSDALQLLESEKQNV